MIQSLVRLGWITTLAVVIAGCSKAEPNALERSDASSLVQTKINSEPPDDGRFPLAEGAFTEGAAQGYWNSAGGLFPKGDEISIGVDKQFLRPKKPPTYSVLVTGIVDQPYSPGLKNIEFTISTDFVTGPARRFIISGYSGIALAQRYDDGWRIQGVRYIPNEDRLTLSSADQAAVAQDLAKEASIRAETDAAQAEQTARFNALLAESRTAKKPYQKFHCEAVIGNRRNIFDLSINDVQVVMVDKKVLLSGGITNTATYPFGHIPSYRLNGDWLEIELKSAGSGTHFAYFYPTQCDNLGDVIAALQNNLTPWWKRFHEVGSAQ